ncbi:MAG: hypothetical protein HYV53_04430 [Parcubacteria group bacterium]|nr:hypothetical protein [Parcubacteria group bacterium]
MEYEGNKCFLLASKNYEFALNILETEKHYDWVVIILFYSALMFAKTLFEIRSWETPQAHQDKYDNGGSIVRIGMNSAVMQKVGKDVGYDYITLYKASRKYRYFPNDALNIDKTAIKQYIFYFKRFKTKIIQELNK